MFPAMALEIRTVSDAEVTAYRHCVMTTFGDDIDSDPDGDNRLRALIAPAQRWAAFDGTTVVATAGSFDHEIGVPGGGTLRMAGLTMVTVRPTHRRKGILRKLIDCHLEDARTRGFGVSGLWASEAGIYGRFGYGAATHADAIAIEDAHTVELRERALDPVEWIDEATARTMLPDVYARATAARPGALRRSETWWRERRFLESPFVRAGASKRRHVIARREGEVVGYIVFRQKGAFDPTRPSGKVDINEIVAIDARAELSLWQFALRIDLFPNVTWWNAPVDDALAWRSEILAASCAAAPIRCGSGSRMSRARSRRGCMELMGAWCSRAMARAGSSPSRMVGVAAHRRRVLPSCDLPIPPSPRCSSAARPRPSSPAPR